MIHSQSLYIRLQRLYHLFFCFLFSRRVAFPDHVSKITEGIPCMNVILTKLLDLFRQRLAVHDLSFSVSSGVSSPNGTGKLREGDQTPYVLRAAFFQKTSTTLLQEIFSQFKFTLVPNITRNAHLRT